jgi:8-oxo-dGTP pyrophosphatase MutT (NUDIX family)
MGFLRHISNCNGFDRNDFQPFSVAGQSVGLVRNAFAEALLAFGDPFLADGPADGSGVTLNPALASMADRTAALNGALRQLVERRIIHRLRGETYPILTRWATTPLAGIDRAAVPYFGLRSFGIHMNGFVRRSDGLHLWVGRRAGDRGIAPGKLDNMVAGGQPMGLSLRDNLIKEAEEEAGMPAALAQQARSAGIVSYAMIHEGRGLRRDTLFIYDLELPADFEPRNVDGEVETFELWPADRVAASIRDTDDWKFNVNLVLIDFLIRHGLIGPDNPEYLSLCHGLRQLD